MAFKYERRSPQTVEKRATQQGGDFQGFISDAYKTYSPKKGDNWIRILPPTWEDADHYGYDVHVHYQVGPDKAAVVCNFKQFNERCPICDARTKAERDNDEELAKDLKPSKRVCVWLIDMKDPDKGALIWPMPWSLDRDISKISKDKRSGETYYIDDPEEGYDLMFDKEGEQITTKYTGVQLARRPSSVDPQRMQYVVHNPLPDTLLLRTYDEVMALYSGGQATEAKPARNRAEDVQDAPAKRPRPSPSQADEEPPWDASKASTREAEQPLKKRLIIEQPEDEDEVEEVKPAPIKSVRPKIAEDKPIEKPLPTEGSSRGQTLRERFAARNAEAK